MSPEPAENYAKNLVEILKDEYDQETVSAEVDGQAVNLECQTEFGLVTVVWVSASAKVDLIRMEVQFDDGSHSLIFTNPLRCSFKLTRVRPSARETEPVGFGAKEATPD
jgi:hypothetical protein